MIFSVEYHWRFILTSFASYRFYHSKLRSGSTSPGLTEEALHHFLAARDVDTGAALLEDNMHSAIDNDLSRRTLGRWLDMFPKSAVDQRAALQVATTYPKMFHWEFISMEPLLDQAEKLLRDPSLPIEMTRRIKLQGDVE